MLERERVIIDIYLSCVDLQLPGNKSRSFLTLTYKTRIQ